MTKLVSTSIRRRHYSLNYPLQDRGVNPAAIIPGRSRNQRGDDQEGGVRAISVRAPGMPRRRCIICCRVRKKRTPEAKDEHAGGVVHGEMHIDPTAVGLPNRWGCNAASSIGQLVAVRVDESSCRALSRAMGNLISQATALGYTTAGGYDRSYAAASARARQYSRRNTRKAHGPWFQAGPARFCIREKRANGWPVCFKRYGYVVCEGKGEEAARSGVIARIMGSTIRSHDSIRVRWSLKVNKCTIRRTICILKYA